MSEKIRCFVGIKFPEEILREIQKIQQELPEFDGKKTQKEKLHLTLKFLGEIEEEKISQTIEKLKEIKFPKFESFLGEIGVFTPNLIKIIWIKVEGNESMNLQKEIDEKLNGLFKKEERFMSHLTIARVKNIKNKRKFLEELEKIKVKNLKFGVNKFYLVKSEQKEEEYEYSVIREFNLS